MRPESKSWDAPAYLAACVFAGLAVLVAAILAYSFPRGLDLTDEAGSIYLLVHPNSAGFVMDHFVWGHLLPRDFGVVAFRWLTAFALLGSGLALYFAFRAYVRQYLMLPLAILPGLLCLSLCLLGGLLYFTGLRPTMGYSATLAMAANLFLAGMLWLVSVKSVYARGAAILGMAIALALVWLARFIVCLPLLFLVFGFLTSVSHDWRKSSVRVLTIIGLAIVFLALLSVFGYNAGVQLRMAAVLSKTSHSPLLVLYDLRYGVQILAAAGLLAIAATLAERRLDAHWFSAIVSSIALAVVTSALMYMKQHGDFATAPALEAFHFNPPVRSLGPAIHVCALALLIFCGISFAKRRRNAADTFLGADAQLSGRVFELACVLYVTSLIPEIGTNTGIWHRSVLSMAPLFLMFGLFLTVAISRGRLSRWGAPILLLLIAAPVIAALYSNLVTRPFRVNGGAEAQTVRLTHPAPLRGLLVSPAVAGLQDQLDAASAKLELPAGTPMVYAHGETGLPLLAGLKVFGAPWYTQGYPGIEHWNCYLAKFGARGGAPLVVGIDVDMLGPYFRSCLSEYAFPPVLVVIGAYRVSLLERRH